MAASGYKLYNALIRPLRQMDRDEGRELLRRMLIGPQAQFEQTEADIQTLPDQLDPSTIRSDLLPYLLAIVGFTTELRSIIDRLSEIQLRRLILVAVPLWKERHTERGLVNSIRLLTGRTAFVTSWFGYRNILGEAMIGEDQLVEGGDNWIIGGDVTVYDEYWTNVRIMDDGTLDELLLLDVIRLMRPMSERIEVFLEDFLDRFDGELDKWTLVAGTQPTIVDGAMLLPADTTVQPIIPIKATDAAHVDYVLVTKFRIEDVTAAFQIRWRIGNSGNNYYRVVITPSGSITPSGTLSFGRVTGGVLATLVDVLTLPISVVAGTWYKLRITTANVGTDRHIQIYLDANLIVPTSGSDYNDNVGVTHQNGPYRFMSMTDEVSLDNVESWSTPARFATVELSTPDEPGGEVTMTANFIQ